MMFWYGSHPMIWQAALMWLAMIAFWALVVWAIYALITAANRRSRSEHRDPDPLQILDQRLARGEIDTAEYQRLRELITTSGQQAPEHARSPR